MRNTSVSHLFQRINTPRKQGGLGPMKIPLLSDLTHQISKDYGVYLEDQGHTLRYFTWLLFISFCWSGTDYLISEKAFEIFLWEQFLLGDWCWETEHILRNTKKMSHNESEQGWRLLSCLTADTWGRANMQNTPKLQLFRDLPNPSGVKTKSNFKRYLFHKFD